MGRYSYYLNLRKLLMNKAHNPTGRWKYGLLLSLSTSLLWAMIPIGLNAMESYMDAYTITWYRFVFAAIVLFLVLSFKKGIPRLRGANSQKIILLLIACIGLCGNYILYLEGLFRTGPGAAQVVIQLGPILLILGGVAIFKEDFSARQLIGLICILAGLALFFHHKVHEIFTSLTDYTLGVILVVGASVTWAAYALAQKQLLKGFNSLQILLLIFIFGSIVFLPTAVPGKLLDLDLIGMLLLAFCVVNTVLAYGCFAEALEHWEASRISAVLAIIPLLTLGFMELATSLHPSLVSSEQITWLSFLGAIVLLTGTVIFVKKKEPSN
jgi:drug/metabolite transporter (DMT)-like permease